LADDPTMLVRTLQDWFDVALARLAFWAALRRIQNQNSQATPPVNNVAPSPPRPSATPDSSKRIAAPINTALTRWNFMNAPAMSPTRTPR